MRTLSTEAAAIESHLFKTAKPEDELLFEAKLIIDPQLSFKTAAQEKTYNLIQLYGRKQLKAELDTVHEKLFTQTPYFSFAQAIRKLFQQG